MNKNKLLAILILCLVAIICWICITPSDLVIDYERSTFLDFYVEQNFFHLRCVLCISNYADSDMIFCIRAESKEDVRTGLLINPQMQGVNTEDGSNVFFIGAGKTQEFTVDFQGEFSDKILKFDRLLPDSIILDIFRAN